MSSEPPASAPYEGPLSPPYVRLLKIAVVVMGLMIFVGLAAVVLRVVYLASGPSGQTAGAISSRSSRAALAPSIRLAVPPGASIRHLALSGDRLAVHYDSPKGPAIAIVDATTGAVLSRIEVVPDVPR